MGFLNSLILCMRHFLFSRPVIYNFNLIMSSRITIPKQTLYKTCAIQVGLSINLEYELLKDLKVPKGFNVQSFKLESLASCLLSYQQTVSQFTRYRRSLVTDSAQRQKGVQWFPLKCHTVDSSVFTLNSSSSILQ